MRTASFVIPTFRETEKIKTLIHSFDNIRDENIDIIIVNGNPNDETSQWLRDCSDSRIIEKAGNPSLYWAGLVNVGLRHILESESHPVYVFLMNADIVFSYDILQSFLNEAKILPPCQLGVVTVSDGKIISSGVQVLSWSFTQNRHPLAGSNVSLLPKDQLIPVDFLPTRCIMFPFEALQQAGITSEEKLPHYCSDYEFTARLSRFGYKAFIATNITVEVDTHNTGNDVYYKKTSLKKRVASLFSVKSPSNPVYLTRFIRMVYPWYAKPSAIVLYLLRSLLEIVLGGAVVKRLFYRAESGFSGRQV